MKVGEEGEKDCISDSYKARRCQFLLFHRKGHEPNRKGLGFILLSYMFGLLLIL